MNPYTHAFTEAFFAELTQLRRSPMLIVLTAIQAVTFIFLVHFFGTTGAFAPTALIDNDHGYYARAFIKNLENAHHSFTLKPMDEKTAREAVKAGKIVAMITIPEGFSEAIDARETVPISVIVDNIDTDMTADIQRALPSAIASFGNEFQLPNISVRTVEHDLIDHDTGFIPYLVVSALGLSAFIIAAILGAVTVAREFETRTFTLLKLAPINPIIPILGKVLATNVVALVTMSIAVSIIIFGHKVIPIHPVELVCTLILCTVLFGLIGAALGSMLKRTLPVASLVFGIALPLYLFSGTYEPERFDGTTIWILAHFTPLYYTVGILEHAVLDLRVTPEPVYSHFFILIGWGILALFTLWWSIRRYKE